MSAGDEPVLDEPFLRGLDERLMAVDERVRRHYPGDPAARQPVHTVYVPAPRFQPDLVATWGAQARSVLDRHGGGPERMTETLGMDITADVYERVVAKLGREPVEDLRIDFEDGYGDRGDAAEDADAVAAARRLVEFLEAEMAPPFVGLRCKGLERATRRRGIRTLDLFLSALLARVPVPAGFVVTLPKVVAVEHAAAFAEVLEQLEQAYGLPAGRLRFEVQIETPQSVLSADGTVATARIVAAAGGRCAGLHYGTYDYSAALGVSAGQQSLAHPAADFAKSLMQVAAAGTGVWVSDGSTNLLPEGDGTAVRAGWREHARLVRRSLERAFYQGWDLHPHQLPSRFLATYAFFRDGLPDSAQRLGAYATRTGGGILDEPATAQALAAFLLRGVDCGALDPAEVARATGLDGGALDRYARRG